MEGWTKKLQVKWLPLERKEEQGGGDKDTSYTSINRPCVVDLILELQKIIT